MTGEIIAQYEILEELGRGGMGVVYKARDTKLDRFVALKFLPPYLTQDPTARDRFIREAKSAAAIEHNHICTIHDITEMDDGRTYIVMSYYSGVALNEKIAEGPIPIEDVIRIGRQTASALAAAHSTGIAHRDIKPGNLIITDSGDVKLVDFGLAKLAGQVDLTKSRSTVGTAAYMSPEQVRGQSVDHRTDLWSLGVVIYEMVTGQRPFQGEYEQALSYAILNVEPEPLDDSDSDLARLDTIVRGQLLVKDQGQRASSAAVISEQLQGLSQGSSGSSVAAVPFPVTSRPDYGRIVAIVAMFVIVGLLAFWIIGDSSSSDEATTAIQPGVTRIAVLPFSVRGNPNYTNLGDGMVDLLSTKIDGAGDWHSVDPRWIFSAISGVDKNGLDPATARKFAEELSASLFVLGNMIEVGGRLRIDAAIYQADGSVEPIGSGTVEGDANDLFDLVDDLAAQLLLNPDDASSERLSELAELTTNSIEALKVYLDGEAAFREFNFVAAANDLLRAVEIDSTFALAWYRLSVVADWTTWPNIALDAAKNAVRFSQKVSNSDRLLFDAMLASRSGDIETAERLYNEILFRDPNDSEALFNLAELLFHDGKFEGRSYEAARNMWQTVLEQEPTSITSLVHLARIAVYRGEYESANGLVDRVRLSLPEGDRNPEFLGHKYIVSKEIAFRDSMLSALTSIDTSTLIVAEWALWATELHIDDFIPVLDIATDESQVPELRGWAYAFKSIAYLAYGRLSDARRELKQTELIDPHIGLTHEAFFALHPITLTTESEFRSLYTKLENWNVEDAKPSSNPVGMFSVNNHLYPVIRLYLLGRVAAKLGDIKTVSRMVFQLEKAALDSPLPNPIRAELAASIRARTMPENSEARLAELEKAFPKVWFQFRIASLIFSLPGDRYERALILQSLGRHVEAVVQFQSLRRTTSYDSHYFFRSLVAKARSLIALGRQIEAEKALRYFLNRWENADPGMEPLKKEARVLLSELE